MRLDVFLSAEFRSVKAAEGTRRALALTERNPAGYPVCKPHKDLQAHQRLFFPGSAVRRCFLFLGVPGAICPLTIFLHHFHGEGKLVFFV